MMMYRVDGSSPGEIDEAERLDRPRTHAPSASAAGMTVTCPG